MLDRKLAPPAQPLNPVHLPSYKVRHLDNGMEVCLLPFGVAEIVEVQVVFEGGYSRQPASGVARYTAANMTEGTAAYTSLQLAQELDGRGAWINYEVDEDVCAFKLATVSGRLSETLPLLFEALFRPTFPQEEFEQMKARTLQKLEVSEQKTSYQARRLFGNLLFGNDHPYGASAGREEVAALTREQLIAYHKAIFHPGNAYIAIVGKFDEQAVMQAFEANLASFSREPVTETLPSKATQSFSPQKGRHHMHIDGLQSTVRLGHLGVKRSHPDFYQMGVVNTLFGGYFGSRLMHNIREEKGYTYGIGSGWASFRHAGIWIIQCDTGNEYVEAVIEEVYKELELLRTKGVEQAELELVKNYLLGQGIRQRETPFQLGDTLRFSRATGISFEEIDRRFEVIQAMQPEEVGPLASKYFQPDQMLEVVAGATSE